MVHIHDILSLMLQVLFLNVGFLVNLFILVLNSMKWRKNQSLNSCDLLVSSLALSNILLGGFIPLFSFCLVIWKDFFNNVKFMEFLVFTNMYLLSTSLWFSTWLCSDYCVRIINSSWEFFLWLKLRAPKLGPWLVVGSIVGSLSTSLLGSFDLYFKREINSTINPSKDHIVLLSHCSCSVTVYMAFTSLAFVIFFCAAVAILTSLYKHIRQMRRSTETLRNHHLDAHFGAAKTVASLLLLYITVYAIHFFIFSDRAPPGGQWFLVCSVVISLFPVLNSAILIKGNQRLSKAFCLMLGHIRRCCKMAA